MSTSQIATTFWLITARRLLAPMPLTPTDGDVDEVARRLEAPAQDMPRHDRDGRAGARGRRDELTPRQPAGSGGLLIVLVVLAHGCAFLFASDVIESQCRTIMSPICVLEWAPETDAAQFI